LRGNNDVEFELPSTAQVQIDGYRIDVVHDSGAAARRSACRDVFDADDTVFGLLKDVSPDHAPATGPHATTTPVRSSS